MFAIPRSTYCGSTSRRMTERPARAAVWAIPLPIVPAPITPTVLISVANVCLPFHRERDRVSAAETERRDPALRAAPSHLVEQGDEHARAARADRVAERDRAAVDVDARRVELQLACDGHRLNREGLVELDEVDVAALPSGLREDLL